MTDPEPPGGPPSSDETLEGTSSTPGGSSRDFWKNKVEGPETPASLKLKQMRELYDSVNRPQPQWRSEKPTEPGYYRVFCAEHHLLTVCGFGGGEIWMLPCMPEFRDCRPQLWDERPIHFLPLPE